MSAEGISNIERRKTNNIKISVLAKIADALNETIRYLGCLEDLPSTTLPEQLIKSMLLHGHTKKQAAKAMTVSIKTIYNLLKKDYCNNETLEKVIIYIKETNE